MDSYTLTTGSDMFMAPPSGSAVLAMAATLNAGDSLIGGAGTDVLTLIGPGSLDVGRLATFAGFEKITVDNRTTSVFGAGLTLGSQAIEVDETGLVDILVNSPAQWNSHNVIVGDPSSTSSVDFESATSTTTYDLTSNTFSNVSDVTASVNVTLLINSAVAAGVGAFFTNQNNDTLVTADATLDLSSTRVFGFRVGSTNSAGTIFTVGDLATAFSIAGGPGNDTLQTTAFTFTTDERNAIFATSSVEAITDPSGTYTPPAPAPGVVTLTTGTDRFAAPASGSTVYATAATLNPGDSLTGGAGTDVLVLVGPGFFNFNQLAAFTGFEKIAVYNGAFEPQSAQLTLNNQPIELDATGGVGVFADSPANWNGRDVIAGDPAHPSTVSLGNSGSSAVTYDLTSNTFSNVADVQAENFDTTLLIDSADAAGIGTFSSQVANELVTSDATLDLSHTTVSGFTVVSTNSAGTIFTVGDLGTAFQIAGGPGSDTIQTTAFDFTTDERNAIFATSSIEAITDPTGTYHPLALPSGTVALTTDNDTLVAPASGSTVYATAATLNPGESLTGGTGTDNLILVGTGDFSNFDLSRLATFTGFETITLDGDSASLTLNNQPVEVDATGRTIRVDQGTEFVSRDLDLWADQRGVTLDFSRPGKPTDNAFIESFNGKFRAECLNAHWFMSLDDARRKCEAWRRDYNEERPHSSIGNKVPIELVKRSAALGPP